MRRVGVAAGALLALTGLAAPLASPADPVATGLRIVERPDAVRIVVGLAGGSVAAREGEVEAIDPEVGDGRAVVAILGARPRARAAPASAAGVTARLVARAGGARVVVDAPPGRFAHVSYRAGTRPDRLTVVLWRADAALPRLSDGCLRITGWSGGREGVARARGLELRPLFEHGLLLSLRDASGRRIAQRPVTATDGRPRPDFSGYLSPGRWSGTLPYRVEAAGTGVIEASVGSARDGALECLVRVPVRLRPAAG